jgi:hypothetical protein
MCLHFCIAGADIPGFLCLAIARWSIQKPTFVYRDVLQPIERTERTGRVESRRPRKPDRRKQRAAKKKKVVKERTTKAVLRQGRSNNSGRFIYKGETGMEGTQGSP